MFPEMIRFLTLENPTTSLDLDPQQILIFTPFFPAVSACGTPFQITSNLQTLWVSSNIPQIKLPLIFLLGTNFINQFSKFCPIPFSATQKLSPTLTIEAPQAGSNNPARKIFKPESTSSRKEEEEWRCFFLSFVEFGKTIRGYGHQIVYIMLTRVLAILRVCIQKT